MTHVAERESNVTNEDSTSERKEVINHDTVGSHRSNVSERHEIKHYVWVIWQKNTNMTHLIAITIHNVHFLSQF